MRQNSVLHKMKPADLVRRAQQGDELAFKELYFKHADYVARMVYSIAGNEADLEDVVQETFFGAYRSLKGLREVEKFKAWLGKIAVRAIFKHLKSKRKIPATPHEMDIFSASEGEPEELRYALYQALGALSPKLRIPWVLHRQEEMSLKEVAELCDISLATTKRHIKKAEKQLRKRLR